MRSFVGEGQLHTAQHEDRSSQQRKGRVYSHLLCADEATSGILHPFQMPHYKLNVNKAARALHRPLHSTGTRHVPGEAWYVDLVLFSLEKTRLIVFRGAQQKNNWQWS